MIGSWIVPLFLSSDRFSGIVEGFFLFKIQFKYQEETHMAFFNSAVTVLQTLVIALGAGLGIWGAINLLEGYGKRQPRRKVPGYEAAHGWWRCCSHRYYPCTSALRSLRLISRRKLKNQSITGWDRSSQPYFLSRRKIYGIFQQRSNCSSDPRYRPRRRSRHLGSHQPARRLRQRQPRRKVPGHEAAYGRGGVALIGTTLVPLLSGLFG